MACSSVLFTLALKAMLVGGLIRLNTMPENLRVTIWRVVIAASPPMIAAISGIGHRRNRAWHNPSLAGIHYERRLLDKRRL
jgi:hypothetical protein